MKTLAIFATILCFALPSYADWSSQTEPDLPGERVLTAVVELKGLRINQAKFSIVYGDNEESVRNAFDSRRRNPSQYSEQKATVKDIGNGKALCTVILPHRDNRGDGGRIFSSPNTVFYAWAKTFTPNGARGELTINSPVKSFRVPRVLTIAYMGDSYASGEGAPNANKTITKKADWDEDDCHRSERSGGILAIKKLIDRNPQWAIRYVNTTCSGAELDDFITADQRPDRSGWSNKPAQLKQVRDWLERYNRTTIDIIMTDGGGNDMGFAPLVEGALTAFVGDVSKNTDLKQNVQTGLESLSTGYAAVNSNIRSEECGFKTGRIIWFNYPNPLNDARGIMCSPSSGGVNPFDCWGPLEKQISTADFNYLKNDVLLKLNAEVSKAAQKHDWDFVDISNRSARNGLCNCDVPYFNTLGQAFAIQGDQFGTMHPNARGFREVYRDPLFEQLQRSIGLWHSELKQDAKARAIAEAKAKAKAKMEWQALQNKLTLARKSTRTKFKLNLPPAPAAERIRLDAADLAPSTKSSKDDGE